MADDLARKSIRNMPIDLWKRVRILAFERNSTVEKDHRRGAGALLGKGEEMSEWQPIETAPHGPGGIGPCKVRKKYRLWLGI